MVRVFLETESFRVPEWIQDLASFRRWIQCRRLPEDARVWFLDGDVYIDASKYPVFTHLFPKTEITAVLGLLVKAHNLGLLFPGDGFLLSNTHANFSCCPDALFASRESLADRLRQITRRGGVFELVGTPDMVLEVVSISTVRKDTEQLRRAYWEAGIPEYWLVDARRKRLSFDILRHTSRGYIATRRQQGWLKSSVFGKSFQLTRTTDSRGQPDYMLAVR